MRQARGQRGQILPIVALALVGLLGVAAFSIDVGYAYYAKRQLQAAVDSAALAGAQDLPSSTLAPATALTYFKDNTPANLPAFGFSYQVKCTATAIIATGCDASVNPNELLVTGTASTNTWLWPACSASSTSTSLRTPTRAARARPRPWMSVIVIDRTGSMCLPDCNDMNGAKAGVQTMLGILNPPYAQIGMVAFPPVQSSATSVCASAYNSESPVSGFPSDLPTFHNGGYNGYYAYDGYDAAGRGYVTDALNGNYKDAAGKPVLTSGLYIHTLSGNSSACIPSDGLTSYSEALRQAQAELLSHGRAKVPNFIVFLTDGEANIGSVYSKSDAKFPQGGSDDQKPCQAGRRRRRGDQGDGYDDLQHRLLARQQELHARGLLQEGHRHQPQVRRRLRHRHGGLLPLRKHGLERSRDPGHHVPRRGSGHRLAGPLQQHGHRECADDDLRVDRERHGIGLEPVGGRRLLAERPVEVGARGDAGGRRD